MSRMPPTAPEPCWLAVRLPHLALDLHTRGHRDRATPVAVSATAGRRERIIDCNPAALAGGARPGMPVTAARAILEGLRVTGRDEAAEQRALDDAARRSEAAQEAERRSHHITSHHFHGGRGGTYPPPRRTSTAPYRLLPCVRAALRILSSHPALGTHTTR